MNRAMNMLLSEITNTIQNYPESVYYLWCKNCGAVLGVVVGGITASEIVNWDANDTACPHCGDNATRISDETELKHCWPEHLGRSKQPDEEAKRASVVKEMRETKKKRYEDDKS